MSRLPERWPTPQYCDDYVEDFGEDEWADGLRHGFLVDLCLSSVVNLEQLSLQVTWATQYGE